MGKTSKQLALCLAFLAMLAFAPRPAQAITVRVRVVLQGFDLYMQTPDGRIYKLDVSVTGCGLDTRRALGKAGWAIFYRDRTLSFGNVYEFSFQLTNPPFLLIPDTGEGLGAPGGKCDLTESKELQSMQGCCSYHGGVSGCVYGRVMCNDGTQSTSCRNRCE